MFGKVVISMICAFCTFYFGKIKTNINLTKDVFVSP